MYNQANIIMYNTIVLRFVHFGKFRPTYNNRYIELRQI